MNIRPNIKTGKSVCPHDCPSACALEVELLDEHTIGRVRGSKDNSYTLGVICEKVGRYAERIHHPDRLLHPLKRKGAKGDGQWQRLSWDDAMGEVAEAFLKAEERYGALSVWPYYYAGTMGLVMRDGINRLRHVKKYSGMYDTFCVALSWPGFLAGCGRMTGSDPREMQKSDLIVIWGTNPVNTQVNVMTHASLARKTRGAKIACVDVYDTGTMKQADVKMIIRPGTDGALACAVMHVLFRDGYADRAYLEKYTDVPREFEAHLQSRSPEWAAAICGCPAAEIEAFAKLIGQTERTYLRIGYGFTRSRNGSVNMHAVTAIAAVTGSWQHEGGGAFHSNSGMYKWNKTLIEGLECRDPSIRQLDQSRIGPVLLNNPYDLAGGPPVTAMIMQNTNPASVAPDQTKVRQGLMRDDLFLCVHEQFMTETAQLADIVLPATMFLEHDDIYQGGGHQHIMLGAKLVEAPGECRNNHEVIADLARRVGAKHQGFDMTPRELIDWTLKNSNRPDLEKLEQETWIDVQQDFETAHFLNGFGHPDGKFRFKPDWQAARFKPGIGPFGPVGDIPPMPDHWGVIEEATETYPFRLATSPARTFLNSTFNETPSSRKREGRPTVFVHPEDLAAQGLKDGDKVRLGSARGVVTLHAKVMDGIRRGVLIAESIWPNDAFEDGKGINTLTGCDQPAPAAGGVFHDNRVWLKPA
ncbi:molybdopterin-containing oxidoreductase family protein [Aestuariivirga sp. YIM B02566]|uniref:Molybdopterin oxidoreductase family protein n=1 Tax=Taklimakanibacter albus TaxID=2800327 RepID=A0ACC5R091_9HYPH|nr:molybdopterin oxidoreductase family protein [Aestuariivirga sp. YIM B02566]MBK1866075.1 molybdopterin oxidoreductase family protein [Aestuariivirga sp. YIM B02566]